ncbi:MAG: FtsW/RodA/SpoVE family cell cycle protein [Lachnospiraceae bacterium]
MAINIRKHILKKYDWRNIDFILLIYIALISIVGLVVVQSAAGEDVTGSLSLVEKQMIGMAIGAVLMVIVALMDYHFILKFAPLWYVVGMLMLLYVEFIETKGVNNAKRWIYISSTFTIQPAEFVKIIMIVVYAVYLSRFREKINHIQYLIVLALITAPPLVLILKQPDLSTTLVIAMSLCMLIFLGGISWKWIVGVIGTVVPAAVVFVYFAIQPGANLLENHQIERILGWLYFEDPQYSNITYQQRYSIMAIASGKLNGKGLNYGEYDSVKNGGFLSEEQCDFIWAVVGEELGLIGCCVIIILLLLLVLRAIKIARQADSFASQLLAGGIACWFGLQIFVNIGVATALLPNTGIPLPFISAGMSSLLSSYIAMGILLNVGLQRKRD